MIKVIGVRFRQAGKIYYFSPGKLKINRGDHVIVETARGVEYGYVVVGNRDVNTIGVYAFRSCISLKEAIFVDGNKPLQVGDNLFYNCPLEKLYVGRNLKFENFSFGKIKTLMTVVFGKEVTCIGDHLFTGCLRLKDIYIEAPIPPAVADGFNPSILSEVILHVPSCSRVIYAERFPWSDFVSIQMF